MILGILSLDVPSHDNNITLLDNKGKVIYAENAERIYRVKHYDGLPIDTLERALKSLNKKHSDIDHIAIANVKIKWKSVIFARNYGIDTFLYLLNFLKNPLTLSKDLITRFKRVKLQGSKSHYRQSNDFLKIQQNKIKFIDHQESHAASAYYSSGFKDKTIAISMDGCGPRLDGKLVSGSAYICNQGKMAKIFEVPCFATFGGLYTSVTFVLGFRPGDGEYKTMGLSCFGKPSCYKEIEKLHPYFKNGKFYSNSLWTDFYCVHNREVFLKTRLFKKLEKLRKKYGDYDLAASLQAVFEDKLREIFVFLNQKHSVSNFVCAGGIFLNIMFNNKILSEKFIKKFFVYPNGSDAGISYGAAARLCNLKYKTKPRKINNLYYGASFNKQRIKRDINKYSNFLNIENFNKKDDLHNHIVQKLIKGTVIGVFDGRAEWGPRALGNRSVIADPRKKYMKDKINKKLKGRDWFMPFGPSGLNECIQNYIKIKESNNKTFIDEFMLVAYDIESKNKIKDIYAASHVDQTSRIHRVKKSINKNYYSLIKKFYEKTKCPFILNTSFNRHGYPIVDTPINAISHLLLGYIEALVIDNYYLTKNKKKPSKELIIL